MAEECPLRVTLAWRTRRASLCPPYAASLCNSLRYHTQYSRHSHDVASRHRELELLIDAPQPAKHDLANAPDRLTPAEVFLDALADCLTHRVAVMARGARIDGAAAAPLEVLGHMRGDVARAALGHEFGRVLFQFQINCGAKTSRRQC